MFVNYPTNCESDSCRMFNPETNGIVATRDIAWQKRMFYPSLEDDFELVVEENDPPEQGEDAQDDEERVKPSLQISKLGTMLKLMSLKQESVLMMNLQLLKSHSHLTQLDHAVI